MRHRKWYSQQVQEKSTHDLPQKLLTQIQDYVLNPNQVMQVLTKTPSPPAGHLKASSTSASIAPASAMAP